MGRAPSGGRIELPPAPASSLQTVDFSTAVFSGSAADLAQRQRLLLALVGSLLLHLGVAALFQRAPATAGAGQPGVASAVLATLRGGAASPQATVASEGPVAVTPPVVDEPPPGVNKQPPGVDEQPSAAGDPGSRPSEALLATLGQRRLAAYVPPYLSQPFVLNSPPGAWYFSRSELTVAPLLKDDPQIESPESTGNAAPKSGKVVLRVFVGAAGAVERVEVASSSVPTAFEEAAIAAFTHVRFRPGEIEGVAVTSETRFEIVFEGGEAGSSHSSDRVGIREVRSRAGAAQASTRSAAAAGQVAAPAQSSLVGR